MAKWQSSMFPMLLLVLNLPLFALANNVTNGNFQAFYFIQQWMGSYCNQKGTPCCYPPSGKPAADFTVYGLWSYTSDHTFPTSCSAGSTDVNPLKPLEGALQAAWPSCTCPLIGRKFWLHEWNKHGTCSESILGEIPYLQTAINLKNRINLLQVLAKAGITPNNQFYSFGAIKQAVSNAFGLEPWIACNHNAQGNSQIWQISLCTDNTGRNLIRCPDIPNGGCAPSIQFPSF